MTLTVGYFDKFSWFRRLNSTQTHQWYLPMLKSLKLDYSCNYISRTFLHHHANVVSYRTNSSFKHGHFLITSCFERNLATLYLTDCSNKAKEITLQTYPYLAGQRRWCRPLIQIYWNVKCSKNEAVKLSNSYTQRPFRFWFQLMDDHISFMSTCYPFDGKLLLGKNNNSFFKKKILV